MEVGSSDLNLTRQGQHANLKRQPLKNAYPDTVRSDRHDRKEVEENNLDTRLLRLGRRESSTCCPCWARTINGIRTYCAIRRCKLKGEA